MKKICKTAMLGICTGFLFIIDAPSESTAESSMQLSLVPEAQAVFGVRRRAVRRGVIVGSSIAAADAAASTAAQAQAAPAAAPPPAPAAPAASDKPLPLGTVVSALPAGCTSTPVGGVEYYYCGGNFYRAVFQGNQLVYVTAKP